jgi:hypothetical protein
LPGDATKSISSSVLKVMSPTIGSSQSVRDCLLICSYACSMNVAYFLHVSRARNTTMNERDQEKSNPRAIPSLLGSILIRHAGRNNAAVALRSAASVSITKLNWK